jgi:hypothetical protein
VRGASGLALGFGMAPMIDEHGALHAPPLPVSFPKVVWT